MKGTAVEFISYIWNGCLCNGELTLRIGEKTYVFGWSKGAFPKFWESGGYCEKGFGDEKDNVVKAPWVVNRSMLPEEIRGFEAEIRDIFNKNVPYGCCGMCA